MPSSSYEKSVRMRKKHGLTTNPAQASKGAPTKQQPMGMGTLRSRKRKKSAGAKCVCCVGCICKEARERAELLSSLGHGARFSIALHRSINDRCRLVSLRVAPRRRPLFGTARRNALFRTTAGCVCTERESFPPPALNERLNHEIPQTTRPLAPYFQPPTECGEPPRFTHAYPIVTVSTQPALSQAIHSLANAPLAPEGMGRREPRTAKSCDDSKVRHPQPRP